MKKRALHQKLFLFTLLSIGHNVMYAMQPHAITNYQNDNLTIHITDKSHPYSLVAKKPICKKTFPCSLCKNRFVSPTGVAIHIARIHRKQTVLGNNYTPLLTQTNNYSMSMEFWPLEDLPFESTTDYNIFTFH